MEPIERWYRFADLKERGIVSNRVTLGRWINEGRFPPGVRLGPNVTAWPESRIREFLDKRAAESGIEL
jgi:hypothetical protein